MSMVQVTTVGVETRPLTGEEMLRSVRPGDRVTILTPHGRERTGRAVIISAGHVALNLGGAHGTPGVATADNIVRVKHSKSRMTAAFRG